MTPTLLPPALLIAVAAVLAAPVASAQTLKGVTVAPASVAAGQPVTITADFDISQGLNCNVRVHFGDGQSKDVKVNQEKDAKLEVAHTYGKPGSYTVKVEPKTAMPALKCLGANQTARLTVTAAGLPGCPPGWRLDAKSVDRKTGAYTCRAKAGTALPQPRPACPGALKYHENAKAGQLGCRP